MAAAPPIEFARDVLPILSANCFSCHGPDAEHRQADLRLDREVDAQESGVLASDAGGHSELIARITSSDPDAVMPPPDSNRQLQPEQIETLRRWIKQGGQWQQHWAFEPISRPADSQDRPVAALDNLVRQRLAKLDLKLQPPASPHTLTRRLSLDLLGVPPTPEQADAFAADQSPAAYEALVDHLLGQPQFGEHWARMWLDLARYADTKGYEKDRGRTMWPYRDWVIAAFNRDLPLDQFTMDQLAGDLLAEPTQAQLIATAFHRNTMSNDEGGTDDEEFRTLAVKDRINTTVQVWMGLTMGCAQCHTHKYDPISIEDYYRFYAIFNQTRDADRSDDAPKLEVSSEQQIAERRRLEAELASLQAELRQREQQAIDDEPLGEQIKASEQALQALNSAITQIPVMRELPVAEHRVTRVHKRGSFLDQGEVVEPAVLAAFHPLPDAAPLDRRGVAQWLVSPENPLTPRVWANRIWARLFGRGLVETEEDFGKLGSVPTHPQLLDLLAGEYRAGGWSLKHLLKTIVMSDTYRQSSHADAVSLEKDPDNQWYSRAPRFRLTGEMLRDQALATAGLLSDKLGGPPVMPPQPAGLWRSTYSGEQWVDAKGEDRFRRGLYTYLKRTTPYPAFTTFDGGSGEVCLIRRIHTNTPLQALITLNDPVFMEAAAGLAIRMLASTSDLANADQQDSARQRAARGLRWALVRPVEQTEIEPLLRLQSDAESYFAANPALAEQLLAASCGELSGELARDMPESVSAAEQAAWILVASTILNLDEYLTRN